MPRRGVIVCLVALVAVVAPPFAFGDGDDFPLSTYPMFSTPRPRVSHVSTVVGVGEDGSDTYLSPEQISGSDEVILAAVTVERAIARGDARTLCFDALRRSGADRLRVVTDRVDVVAWFDDRRPLDRNVHAVCTAGGVE